MPVEGGSGEAPKILVYILGAVSGSRLFAESSSRLVDPHPMALTHDVRWPSKLFSSELLRWEVADEVIVDRALPISVEL
jgi:hypothetical protein